MRSISPLVLLLLVAAAAALALAGWALFSANRAAEGPKSSPSAGAAPQRQESAPAATAGAIAQPKKTEPAAAEVAVADAASKPAPARTEAVSEAEAKAEPEKKGFAKGIVLDYDGKPASGAKVYILAKKGFSMAPPDGETNAKGEFDVALNVKKKRTMRLRVSRKDRLPIFAEDVVFKTNETNDVGTLQFKPSAALEVVVTDRDNRPIPSASVWLEFPNEKETEIDPAAENDPNRGMEVLAALTRGSRATDEEGRARFHAVPPGRIVVNASPPDAETFGGIRDRVRRRSQGAEPKSGSAPSKAIELSMGDSQKVEMVLSGLALLTGRAKVHGEPLAGEWLGLHEKAKEGSLLGKFGFTSRARTDADGRFAFPPVPPGKYVLKKGDPGAPMSLGDADDDSGMGMAMQFASRMFKGNDSAHADLGRVVEVAEGSNQVEVDFGGAFLEVFVQDADDGSAVANATIRVFDWEKPNKTEATDSSAKTGVSINGIAEQFLPNPSGRRAVRLKTTSDSRGRGEFQNIEGGTFRIMVRAEGRPPSPPVELALAEGQYERAIVKIPRGTTVSGTVNDRLGNAIDGGRVMTILAGEVEPAYPDEFLSVLMRGMGPAANSDEKGNFRLNGLDRGEHRIVATADGYGPAVLTVRAPSEGNQFFLDKTGSVRVTVRREGAPIKGVMVSVDTDAEDAPVPKEVWNQFSMLTTRFGTMSAVTNDQGVAVLKAVPAGEWRIEATDFQSGKSAEDLAPAVDKLSEDTKKEIDQEIAAEGSASKALEKAKKRLDELMRKKGVKVRVVSEQESAARIDLDR